ncbi:hypothetical protein HZA26_01215 [Candidatus Nomurabacteria bacterium]|nr:hypothetical protein [Candidatus Nomurabacteria bacterium]
MTKVDLSANPFVYAIPVKEIAKVLSANFFKPKENQQLQASWKTNSVNGERGLEIETQDSVIWASSRLGNLGTAGGEIGNGGGEIGNGGGEIGNGGDFGAKYWELEISDIYNNKRMIVTANPFLVETQSLRACPKIT